MEIILSAETEGVAANKWFELQKELSPLLLKISAKNYGESLESIGIITILMRDEYFIGGGYKERKFYSRERKEADIRLRLNYRDFVMASKDVRKEIYINHILECISIAGQKAGRSFNSDCLLADVKDIFDRGQEDEDVVPSG